jgi:predicted RNA binding protein YcfA (HicA-like mRNA interferase family)
MPKLPVISAKEFLRLLLKHGCLFISSEGSHFKIEYPPTGKRTTIPVHGNRDIDRNFMKRILEQLNIDENDLF